MDHVVTAFIVGSSLRCKSNDSRLRVYHTLSNVRFEACQAGNDDILAINVVYWRTMISVALALSAFLMFCVMCGDRGQYNTNEPVV